MQVIDVNLHVLLWLSLVLGKQSEALGYISNTGNDSAYMRLDERSLRDKDNHLDGTSGKYQWRFTTPGARPRGKQQKPCTIHFHKKEVKNTCSFININ